MRPTLILTLLFTLFPFVFQSQNHSDRGAPDRERPVRSAFEGARIFQNHCAACHGSDGRGHGPSASALKLAPANLTVISQRNSAKFPYQRVKDFIEGKEPGPLAHGTREMPIWGPIFHEIEADQDWGEVKLDAVTRHIESIQQK